VRLDRKIGLDTVTVTRIRKKDGGFLFSPEKCLRYLEILLERQAKPEPEKKTERQEETRPAAWKPTGRGKTFWVDSE
jgi:hypothetical protein